MSGYVPYLVPSSMFPDWAYNHATEAQLRDGLAKAEQAVVDARREAKAFKKALKDRGFTE